MIEKMNMPAFVKGYFTGKSNTFVGESLKALNDNIFLCEDKINEIISYLNTQKCPYAVGVEKVIKYVYCNTCTSQGSPYCIEKCLGRKREKPEVGVEELVELLNGKVTWIKWYHDKECGKITDDPIICQGRFREVAEAILSKYEVRKR